MHHAVHIIKADGTVRYYQTDALGSVIALTDETGVARTTYSYDPFGSVTISGEASDNPFQYTGRENDGTGLYYYRARYYSPELQRFISEDPIGFEGGDMNVYIITHNNPLNIKDPLGLEGCGPVPFGDWFVPDFPFGNFFLDCCNQHDKCYGYGCEGESKGMIKADCDNQFCNCLRLRCILFPMNPSCYPLAEVYCIAVKKKGDDSFNKARRKKSGITH